MYIKCSLGTGGKWLPDFPGKVRVRTSLRKNRHSRFSTVRSQLLTRCCASGLENSIWLSSDMSHREGCATLPLAIRNSSWFSSWLQGNGWVRVGAQATRQSFLAFTHLLQWKACLQIFCHPFRRIPPSGCPASRERFIDAPGHIAITSCGQGRRYKTLTPVM